MQILEKEKPSFLSIINASLGFLLICFYLTYMKVLSKDTVNKWRPKMFDVEQTKAD